jgi:hypothetical protein
MSHISHHASPSFSFLQVLLAESSQTKRLELEHLRRLHEVVLSEQKRKFLRLDVHFSCYLISHTCLLSSIPNQEQEKFKAKLLQDLHKHELFDGAFLITLHTFVESTL